MQRVDGADEPARAVGGATDTLEQREVVQSSRQRATTRPT